MWFFLEHILWLVGNSKVVGFLLVFVLHNLKISQIFGTVLLWGQKFWWKAVMKVTVIVSLYGGMYKRGFFISKNAWLGKNKDNTVKF